MSPRTLCVLLRIGRLMLGVVLVAVAFYLIWHPPMWLRWLAASAVL